MIYEFSFSNYRSYRDETTLSFVAQNVSEHEKSLINAIGEKLVPVCSIYGPNGGGKSSVLMALRYMASLVMVPYAGLQRNISNNEERGENSDMEELARTWRNIPKREYYMWNNKCKDEPSNFSILFQSGDCKYRYEISVMHNEILSESLYVQYSDGKSEGIFERDGEDIFLSEKINLPATPNVNSNLPLLVYLGTLMHIDEIDEAIYFFATINYINFDDSRRDGTYPIRRILYKKDLVLKLIQSMGINIGDIRVEYSPEHKIRDVYTRHILSNGKLSEEIDFLKESGGTRKIFCMISDLLDSIENGELTVIDEMDAKLHPLLVQGIIGLYTNPNINRKGAQLLFTSHDITSMNNDVFRRDEIWFAALNAEDQSLLYSLAEFKKEGGNKVRKDETYGKQYLEGRYGADPFLKRIVNWENGHEFKTTEEK